MEDVEVVVDTNLWQNIPDEAWNQLSAGPNTVRMFGGIEGFKKFFLTMQDWDFEEREWIPKRTEDDTRN